MAKKNIIIVGAGLFGNVAAALARAHGHTVTVVAERRAYEASPASGCVLAPSWLSSLEKSAVADSMAVLGELYKLHSLEFQTNLVKTFKAQRVHTPDVLKTPDVQGRVSSVGDGVVKYVDVDGGERTLRGIVLVAAGIWCGELIPGLPAMKGLYGASLRAPGQLEHPRIHVYAPYRQAVAFNLDKKTVWFGDGTALIARTWDTSERERVSKTRARAAAMDIRPGTHIIGARPYVEGHKAGYFKQISPKLYVTTGGAKNGTVLAAWQALQFIKGLK